ncbi:HIT family protein [soil metagenome]
MATIFTRIIEGELPGRFVWRDDRAVAFLSINPLRPGHTLVVPIQEIDHWIDLDPDLVAHLTDVARTVGRALHDAFGTAKVALIALGLEVPHTHLHLVPIESEADVHFERAERDPDPAALDDAAERIRQALRAAGGTGVTAG